MEGANTKYFGDFRDREDVAKQFECGTGSKYDFGQEKDPFVVAPDFPAEEDILYACYNTGSYEGDAHILFLENGKLFEVNASHCSCYGLEGQWTPEETSLEALEMRKGYMAWPQEALELVRKGMK